MTPTTTHPTRRRGDQRTSRWLTAALLALGLSTAIGIPSHAQAAAGADPGAARLERIRDSGILRVCIWPGYFAISYRNPRSGDLEGVDIDMAHAFAGDLGVNVQFVDSSFAALKQNMTSDACDISMHAVGVRPDRAETMDFSEPHLISGIYAVAPVLHPTIQTWADIDQPGNVVVVQKGTYMEPVMRETLRQAEVKVVETFKAREQEVQAGRGDVFMTDYPYGQRMIRLSDWAKLLEPPEPLAPTPYAYAVPKGEPSWLARVNAFVRDAKADGRLKAFAETHGLTPIVAE